MKRSFASLFLVIALSLPGLASAARGVELRVPAPMAVPVGMAAAQLGATLKTAIQAQPFWSVPFERPGYVEALMKNKGLRVHVGLLYDGAQVRMVYLESHGFHYSHDDDGSIVVHKKLNNWMKNLHTALSQALANPAAAGQASAGAAGDDGPE